MAFTREELASYEKQPAKQISDQAARDPKNFFRGAKPAAVATGADMAQATAKEGQPSYLQDADDSQQAAAATAADDSPVVDEDGSLTGDPTDSGEGTSDESNSEESSASAVDPSDETDPNADLTATEGEEEPEARPAPKKGSAAERIVELNDLADGYKVFGQNMQEGWKAEREENERLRAQLRGASPATATTAVPPAVEVADEPMPDLADEDIAFDNDKYRVKMAKWVKNQTTAAAQAAVRQVTGQDQVAKTKAAVEEKVTKFAAEHPDFKKVVVENPVLAQNQLAPDAGLMVAESEHTADLLYAFGKDPAMAIRVAKMAPAQQIAHVTRMIVKIEQQKEQGVTNSNGKNAQQGGAKPAQKKSITQAPPPPRATPAAGRTQARDPLDPNTSMEEFARQHRQGKQSAREQNRKQRGLN